MAPVGARGARRGSTAGGEGTPAPPDEGAEATAARAEEEASPGPESGDVRVAPAAAGAVKSESGPSAEPEAEQTEAKAETKTEAEAQAEGEGEEKAAARAGLKGHATAKAKANAQGQNAVGRPSKPALAGAAFAGLVLLVAPLTVAEIRGEPGKSKQTPVAFGDNPNGGQDDGGYVPGATDPKTDKSGAPQNPGGSQSPGASTSPSGGATPNSSPSGTPSSTPSSGSEKGGGTGGGGGDTGQRKATPVTATALAGPGCSSTSGSSYQEVGRYSGWKTFTDSSPGGGCAGRFTAMEMSGEKNEDGRGSIYWRLKTGAVSSGTCSLSVYIPGKGRKETGGRPAYYSVNGRFFTIDQHDNRLRWVNAGSFPVSGGVLTVKLHDRGIDYGEHREGARLAAGPIRARCKA